MGIGKPVRLGGLPLAVYRHSLSLALPQRELLAVGALIVLSVFLRQRASPESKPVTAANAETGA